MQNYQITQAGITAAFYAGSGGPKIEINEFRLGTAYGYTPSLADTSLHGSVLYSGVPLGYAVINQDTCQYSLHVDETVGNFDFGEIGLYINGGVLFALQSLQLPQRKIAQPDSDWNEILLKAQLQLTNLPALIQWTVENLTTGVILELSQFELVDPPDTSDVNACIVHQGDEEGNHAFITKRDGDIWDVSTHRHAVVAQGTVGSATGVSVSSPDIFGVDSLFPLGKYLLRFRTGVHRGQFRRLAYSLGSTVGWATAFPTPANVGDKFDILQSDVSLLQGSDDLSFLHALMLRKTN
jgi:hypothetical protein